ncbi:MAG: hypothetical protein ACRDIA_08430 [Actinomycetota bacterium]
MVLRFLATKRHATNKVIGATPITRHHPREMSFLAGSLTEAKVRSAPVRRL